MTLVGRRYVCALRAYLFAAVFFVFAALMHGPAVAQTVDEIISKGSLVIAMDTANPPYAMMDENLKPTGFDVEVAQLMADALGVKLEIISVPSAQRISSLLSNKCDLVISALGITPARAQQFLFSDPYTLVSAVIVAPRDAKINSLADLEGKKVAVTRGTPEDLITTAYSQAHGNSIEILRFDDYPSSPQALLSGQVDAIGAGDYAYLESAKKDDPFAIKFALKSFYFGVAIRRGNFDLLQWVNTFLFSIRNDGTLNALSLKYRHEPMPPLPAL